MRPERSFTTGANAPPYAEVEHPDLLYDGADLRTALVRCLQEFRPTIVVLPDPLDRHPDHRASGLFTLLALDAWRPTKHRPSVPRLLAYLIHWPNWPPGWDASMPPAPTEGDTLNLPATLPSRDLVRTVLELTDAEMAAKSRALDCYVTQEREMPALFAAFVRRTEPFSVLGAAILSQVGEMIEHPAQGGQTR
jgi:LmbE family N-acetylglucosaminyl deacetylase